MPRPDPRADPRAREPWFDRLLQALHLRAREPDARDDLEDALAEATKGDHPFSPQERAMLKNVLGLHRVRVDDVMIPRADIVAVSADTPLGDLLRVFRTAGHSRLPVYGETLDDPRGMVHIRDFLDHIAARAEAARPAAHGAGRNGGAVVVAAAAAGGAVSGLEAAPDGARRGNAARGRRAKPERVPSLVDIDLSAPLASTRILRPVLFVPPSMPAMDLLVRMQATRTHMALVIDEYGGTDGLISIEDLVEMVVGDIEDEHDVAEGRLVVRDEAGPPGEGDVFLADARAGLDEVSEALGADLAAAVGDLAEEVDTIGGLIVTLAGRVPSRGELIAGPDGFEFEVADADPRRVKRLRVHHRPARAEGGAETSRGPRALPGPVVPRALPPPGAGAGTPADAGAARSGPEPADPSSDAPASGGDAAPPAGGAEARTAS